MNATASKYLKFLRYLLKRLVVIFFICLLLRIFCFEIFVIPSGSMENTTYQGDFVYVNKIYFGARLPKHLREVPWLNVFSLLFNGAGNNRPVSFSTNSRMPGVSKIKNNDILVFNQPLNQDEYFIKRCIGLPGDNLILTDESPIVNGNTADNSPNIKLTYRVFIIPNSDYTKLFMELKIPYKEDWYERTVSEKTVLLTQDQKAELLKNPMVGGIRRMAVEQDQDQHDVATIISSDSNQLKKSMQIRVPYSGMRIPLNATTYKLYKTTINSFENTELSEKGGIYYINHDPADSYIFRNNYYFMEGDNRDYSVDSRTWGPMPEFCIVGKAEFVIFSKNSWKRIFKDL